MYELRLRGIVDEPGNITEKGKKIEINLPFLLSKGTYSSFDLRYRSASLSQDHLVRPFLSRFRRSFFRK